MGRIRAQDIDVQRKRLGRELGTIRKDWGGRLPIALCYPNSYAVGMCNLGFQSVYGLFNSARSFVCERVFAEPVLVGSRSAGRGDWTGDDRYQLESRSQAIGEPLSVESQRPLTDFAVVAFSLSFELDYFNVGDVLRRAGIPPMAADRTETDPIVIAGGPAASGNPEPVAPMLDAVIVGEVEPVMDGLQEVFLGGGDRWEQIDRLSRLPGVYVPARYAIGYEADGTISGVDRPDQQAALPVARLNARNVNDFQTMSTVLSPDIELGDMFLIEMTRGCARGCRFCLAGYTSLPVRHRNVDHLMDGIQHGMQLRKRVGLISAATSDHPHLEQLLQRMLEVGADVSLSSLRIDRITPFLVEALVRSRTRTITLAPEAGSQRMRDVINKRLTHDQIVHAAELAGRGGIPNVKLYFIVGLPGETDDDARELAALSGEILERTREHNRYARVAVNLSPHVPKAQTAFQWEAMADVETSTRRIKLVQRALGPRGIDVRFEAPAAQRVQAILARGDRRLAPVLLETQRLQQFEPNLRRHGLDAEFYLGSMEPNGIMPWSLVSTGVPEWYLKQEFGRARGLGGQDIPLLELPPKAAALVEAARGNGSVAPLTPSPLPGGEGAAA
ncbi:MAG: radical SAM protein [Chloroflexi bacterium]|nr:radical SAM protein [Chloroflexota bacterium]